MRRASFILGLALYTLAAYACNGSSTGKKAADAGKFDEAVAHAQQAEALANGSIAQAKEQEKLWPDAVIR